MMKKVANFERRFLAAAVKSLALYDEFGARSNRKLYPMHGCIAKFVHSELGGGYEVKSFGINDNREATICGRYYDKQTDITVLKDGKPLAVVSFKFVTSNYKQNSVNYFEHMLGETANLRRNDVGFAHILVLRGGMPYLARDGREKKTERITAHNLQKYVCLFRDQDYPHRPDLLAISLIDAQKGKARFCEGDLDLPEQTVKILRGGLSLGNFARKFPLLCKIKE